MNDSKGLTADMNAQHGFGADRSREEGSDRKTSRPVLLVDNRLDSRDLFIATREITIGHAGDVYRLRLTAQNKLILTK